MPINFSLKFLDTSLTVQSSVPEIIDSLSFIYGNHRSVSSSPKKRVYVIRKGEKGYDLIHDGKRMFKNFTLDAAIENIEISIEMMVAAENPEIVFFHTGMVSDRAGNAYLILAESGGGKTTLCSMLAQRNFYLEGDELVGFSPKNPLQPLPLKKAPKLRKKSLSFMKDTGRWLVVSSRGEGENRLIYWLPDEETDLRSKDKKKRLKKLFFLNFSPRGRNSISTLSPSEAVSDLVDACHDFYEKRLSALDIVLAVIHQVESYRICYNQPDYALAGIENISKV